MSSVTSPAPTSDQLSALAMLRAERRFLLVGHVRPDGDCLGAQGALARGLQALGKQVVILNPDDPGPRYDYLYEHAPFQVYAGGEIPAHDVCCLLDINELSRCGAMASSLAQAASKKLVVDHHPFDGEPWWDASFVDIGASATGVLVWRILRQLGVTPDLGIAEAVFTALVTDTGWFRYSNTDVETISLASELVGLGVQPAMLYDRLFQRNLASEPKAMAELLGRLEYFADGRLAVVDQPLSREPEKYLMDADPVLDILRAVGDVEVVLYLRELEPGRCKLSARSKHTFDVNRLARQFGGGGHVRASGATIAAPLPKVREDLVRVALEMMEST